MDINQLLEALDLARFNCAYCDVRVEDTAETSIRFKNFELESCNIKPSLGAFIRVRNHGKWFYSATTSLTAIAESIQTIITQSEYFRGNPTAGESSFGGTKAEKNHLLYYAENPVKEIPVTEKLELCRSYFPVLREFEAIQENEVLYNDSYKVKYFKSSTGRSFSYDFNQCGLYFAYTLKKGEAVFNDAEDYYSDDFSNLKSRENELRSLILESSLFLNAETVEPGQYPVILDSEVVGIFAHESFGHKSEADFMLGDEQAKEAWKIGETVGSSILSIVDEGTRRGTSGYAPFDDEGTAKEKTYLIKNGVLSGRLHSGETAQALEEEPTGNGRAFSFEFEPVVRMTCTYVEPGEQTFEELLALAGNGMYIKTMRHGSGMSTFTIAPGRCYRVRDGKVAEPVRISVISGTVFETLTDIEACSKEFKLKSSIFTGCMKVEQPMPVAFGGPRILVRKMMVS